MEKQKDRYKNLDPYKDINFVERRALIKDKNGKTIIDELVEFPDFFSEKSVNIVTSKYLCNEAKRKETSIRQMIDRVSDTIAEWGKSDEYFQDENSYVAGENYYEFLNKLKYYQINQYFTFNSPVYFNCGLSEKPQNSACFILEVEDDMESIYESIKLESYIFKHGSGSGMNMSKLRSNKEKVHGGGFASGPTSFLKSSDTSAGVIKSAGTFRRSAKLVCLNADHPDILEFIHCKEREEKKLRILKKAGFKQMDGYEMSDEVFFQNTNLSLTAPDDFMSAVESNKDWWTKYVLTGERCEKFRARDLLKLISELAWRTGDPGFQYSDNINKWNTCTNSGSIVSTNPCGEFAWLDNSSCNLAAINLLKFFSINERTGKIIFDYEKYKDVIKLIIKAQDILVSHSAYPSRKITLNTHNYRPLGLGYSNLGSLIMWLGLPYDSEEGRNIAALLTALLTGIAFETSNELANKLGAFSKFEDNIDSYYHVLHKHKDHMNKLLEHSTSVFSRNDNLISQLATFVKLTSGSISKMLEEKAIFRNAQLTLLAPTGTTSFMMDCPTKGIEPEFSLISFKTLSGNDGATIKMINQNIKDALKNLGYNKDEVDNLCDELHSLGHFENSEILSKGHLPIFDTANSPKGGKRYIDYMGHVKMVAAVQPFLSGAISKTINMPKGATVDEIYNLFVEAWRMGLKGITIYRDGSKEDQPLNTFDKNEHVSDTCSILTPCKKKLPATRPGEIHKFSIGSTEGYLMTGEFENKELGETFLTVAKQGSTLSGLLDMLAIMISISLQHGVPLKTIVSKLMFSRFDPSGITSNPDIRFATSICDYLGRYLGNKYLKEEDKMELGLKKQDDGEGLEEFEEISIIDDIVADSGDAPVCDCCGGMMQRVGTCFNCNNCGANSGACG